MPILWCTVYEMAHKVLQRSTMGKWHEGVVRHRKEKHSWDAIGTFEHKCRNCSLEFGTAQGMRKHEKECGRRLRKEGKPAVPLNRAYNAPGKRQRAAGKGKPKGRRPRQAAP